MERKKFDILNISLNKIIFGFLIGLASFTLNFTFSQNSFAEYKATLSASVNETTASINGTEIIESSDETAEHEINLKINTTNKTGYTATFSSKTDETALLNTNPAINTKIDSISSNYALANFPANTWGYRFDDNAVFSPIPAKSASVNLIKTTEKSTSEENHNIKLGMKLNSSLKPGNYENRLIVSVVSNPYTPKAVMAEGGDFSYKLYLLLKNEAVEMKYFKKSTVAPAASVDAINIEDEDSDYEIKFWTDPTTESVYYYAEPEKVYLNTDSSEMFASGYPGQKIKNILELDLSGFDTSKVICMGSMFEGMRNLTNLNLSNFDTSNVTDMIGMFDDMRNLTTLDISNFDTSNVTDMSHMFEDVRNLTTLDISNFDTSKVTNMNSMFESMSSLTTLNLFNFNTSNVTNMGSMFQGMSNLTTLNLSNFDTSKVTKMYHMFAYMRNLTNLNLSNFDTSKVTDMSYMFQNVSNLTTLNLSNFDTSKVTDMGCMFYGMSKLATLDLSNFDTSKVTDMHYMFSYMTNLTTLYLSNFDTSNVTDMRGMFYLDDEDKLADKLEKIYVNNDFNTTNLINFSAMFGNRKKLRGGNGSFLADPSTADLSWLRVDCPGVQGYFTRKS